MSPAEGAPAPVRPLSAALTDAQPAAPVAAGGSVVGALLRVVVPGLVIVHFGVSLALHHASYREHERRFEAKIARILDARGRLAAEPLWTMQYDKLDVILRELLGVEGVHHAAVLDDTDTVVAEQGRREQGDDNSTVETRIVYADGNIRAAAGRLSIELDRRHLVQYFRDGLIGAIMVALLAALATIAGLWFAVHRFVGRPLAVVTRAIVRSGGEGGHHARAEVLADDEIGRLAMAFNAMQAKAEASEERLDHLASHDPLTGLANRRSFEETFRKLVAARRDGTIALHFVDMNRFKAVNDTHGHAAGDLLLRRVAQRLREVAGDLLIARIGGDEFLILQPDADEAAARDLAQRMSAAIARPIDLGAVTLQPAAAIGVAVRRRDDPEIADLLALADTALYEAKASGTDRVRLLDDDLRARHVRVRCLESGLGEAFAQRQFEALFQGQYDLATGELRNIEALARWRKDQHGRIGPDEFLPVIYRHRLAPRLTNVMLQEACQAAARILQTNRPGLRVAINLSAAELADPGLIDRFIAAGESNAVPLTMLEAELTENALLTGSTDIVLTIERLRRLGVTIALDDFGTGYSSLACLRRLPLDKLKIDKAFVADLTDDDDARAVFGTITALARRLDLEIVAEGLEDGRRAALVRELGANLGQGYLFQKPSPLCDILRADRPTMRDRLQDRRIPGEVSPIRADVA